jgi:hypothetical protein
VRKMRIETMDRIRNDDMHMETRQHMSAMIPKRDMTAQLQRPVQHTSNLHKLKRRKTTYV